MDLSWYNTLNKPFFNPPSWLFGPVWTVLYIMIAVSGILILRNGFSKKQIRGAMKLFAIQLGLNLAWSPIFFGLHQIALSVVVIVFMWYFIFQTIRAFAKINVVAAYLLYPYFTWVTFASILNLSIAILNR